MTTTLIIQIIGVAVLSLGGVIGGFLADRREAREAEANK